MTFTLRTALVGAALCALVFANTSLSRAATIIKLNLGGVGPDVSMTAGGILGTASDGVAGTTGDQNTDIEYTGFLDPLFPDLNTSSASFTMSNLTATGAAQVLGSLVIQNYSGGTFNLFDPSNSLLLSGTLTTSSLTGVVGAPGTGGLFTTAVTNVTGGSLQPYIVGNSLTVSVNLLNVNGGAGFSVSGQSVLQPFTADASVSISGITTGVPEPGTLALSTFGALGLLFAADGLRNSCVRLPQIKKALSSIS